MGASLTAPPNDSATVTRPAVRVLALIDHFALGGAETLLGQFAATAPAAGIDLSVACLADRDGNPTERGVLAAGVTPTNLHSPGRPGPETIRRVRRHIEAVGPDIVHTHLGTSDWVGGLAARSLGVPMVSTIHQAAWRHDLDTFVKRSIVGACAARVIAVSEEAKRAYAARIWGSAGKIAVVHNGIDVRTEPGSGAQLRRELGLREEDLVVGMISALRPEKGHDIALDAARLLTERIPRLRLVIVGDGPAAPAIASRAAGLEGRVILPGRRADAMRCMDAFDVCLHPSREDAFPTTLLEAMAASVPVLATRVGGIPEIVSDGQTGVLVDVPSAVGIAGALEALLADEARRRALARAGRKAYEERFTAGPWARRTRAVYDEVLSGMTATSGSAHGEAAWLTS